MTINERLAQQLPSWRERITKLAKENGDVRIGEVTVGQILGGMRGVNALVTDISYVDPFEGVMFRGYTIPEVIEKLPKAKNSEYPLAGGLYYLLLIGHIPVLEDALLVEEEWKKRSELPEHLFDVLKSLPKETHPMTMLSHAILCLQSQSIFAKNYSNLNKLDYWEATLEDSLNLTAKIPTIAAYIYNLKNNNGKFVQPDPDVDWSANFAHMIGKGDNDDYKDLCRLFFIIHADHENANVSAHTAHLVNSALSDVYLSCSAAMNGLAGPLHGLANQGCLRWLMDLKEQFGGLPTKEQLEEFAWDTLRSGKVIPGFGHAVLRRTDPRFLVQHAFAKERLPEDELFQLINLIYEVIPRILAEYGKVKNPWPNVDAITGTLQYHYGVKEMEIYTVMFGISRLLGLTSNLIWDRALGFSIERPQSLTTKMLESAVHIFARG